jgi:hypothetical protein
LQENKEKTQQTKKHIKKAKTNKVMTQIKQTQKAGRAGNGTPQNK